MFLGEFGTDAFQTTRYPPLTCPLSGMVNEDSQANWDLSLWDDLFHNLSARFPAKVALGGTVLEWNDEWWKVQPPGSQENCGHDANRTGHPDQISNEEYYGIVDIERKPRRVYATFRIAFDPCYVLPQTLTFRSVSRGATAREYPSQYGVARFFRSGALFYEKIGGGGGGRGFNVAVIDENTGEVILPVRNFDTWGTRTTGAAMSTMIAFLNSIPKGRLILIAVADDTGLTLDNSCTKFPYPWVESGLQALEALGSRQIRNYCFQNSWAMIAVKGEGQARQEQLESAVEVSVETSLLISKKKDFNADGKPDLVWQHRETGQIGVWFMDQATQIGWSYFEPAQVSDTGWKIVGVSDLNADDKLDLIWQHQMTGQIGVWLMNGTTLISTVNFTPAQVTDISWKIVGISDFNCDGQPDLVWHNQASGQIGVWLMNGTTLSSVSFFDPPQVSDTNWKIVGTNDFNSDGKPDLGWQN
jgi:hypothetical protein